MGENVTGRTAEAHFSLADCGHNEAWLSTTGSQTHRDTCGNSTRGSMGVECQLLLT